MARPLHRGLAAAYALAVAAVFGFGIREATAAPAAKVAAACTIAELGACYDWCDSMGSAYDYAVCTEYGCECRTRMCGNAPC